MGAEKGKGGHCMLKKKKKEGAKDTLVYLPESIIIPHKAVVLKLLELTKDLSP